MFSTHALIGAGLALYVLLIILTGRVSVSDGDRSNGGVSREWIARSKEPVKFWLFVIFWLAVAIVLFFNVFNLPF